MLIANIGVPMVDNVLTFIGNQKLCGYVLGFLSILYMLKIDVCFILEVCYLELVIHCL